MTSDICIRIGLPLTMRSQPLRMRVSRDLCVGAYFPHIFEIPDAQFAYSLYNLYGSTIKTNWITSKWCMALC